jgi:serine/threonine protein kinase
VLFAPILDRVEVSQQSRVIAGRYRLESLIGEGGMASIWRARDLTLERSVAVKLLFARDERDKQRLVRQFLREARIAASVHHRNVIQIVDFGTTDEQQPFMVMELLEGESLGQRLHRTPPMTLAEMAQVASLTLRGLAAVHESGIIHRDLKPDNVFLTVDVSGAYFPKILDFGISRSTEPRSGRRSALTTREGMIVGTPEYMSPEQARGVKTIDRRTDIYSMGAILYEAMSGHLPFTTENVGDLIIQIVTGTVQPACERNPALPRPLSDVIAKAMARAPEDRFQTALDMQQALLSATEVALGASVRRTLSDFPSLGSGTLPGALPIDEAGPRPTVSQERLRTLEFELDLADAQAAAARSPLPRPPPVPNLDEVLPSPRRNLWRAAMAAAVAMVLTGATGLLLSRDTHSSQVPIASVQHALPVSTALTATAAMAPAHVAAASTTIKVSLHNVPSSAHVSVDGEPVSGNEIELPRDGRNRLIKVTAPGKAPWQAVHHASADAAFDVWLIDDGTRARSAKSASTAGKSSTPATSAASVPRRTHKKPPSALRNLDF